MSQVCFYMCVLLYTAVKCSVGVQTSDDVASSPMLPVNTTSQTSSLVDSTGRRANKSGSKTVTFANDSCLEELESGQQSVTVANTQSHLTHSGALVSKNDLAEMQKLAMDLLKREKATSETNVSQVSCVRRLLSHTLH